MRTRTRLGGARQLGYPVRRHNFFSYKHFGSPTRGEMAQIVSGARHFVEYVTCQAVSRETISVLEGTAVAAHNSIYINAPQSYLEGEGCLGYPRPYKQGQEIESKIPIFIFL